VQKQLNRSRCRLELTHVGPRTRVLGGFDISYGKRQFWTSSSPPNSSGSLCCGICSKKDHLVLNSVTAATDCNAPDWSVSHYIVPRAKSDPSDAMFRQNYLTTCLLLLLLLLLLTVFEAIIFLTDNFTRHRLILKILSIRLRITPQ